jgi:hypothetical protein
MRKKLTYLYNKKPSKSNNSLIYFIICISYYLISANLVILLYYCDDILAHSRIDLNAIKAAANIIIMCKIQIFIYRNYIMKHIE